VPIEGGRFAVLDTAAVSELSRELAELEAEISRDTIAMEPFGGIAVVVRSR